MSSMGSGAFSGPPPTRMPGVDDGSSFARPSKRSRTLGEMMPPPMVPTPMMAPPKLPQPMVRPPMTHSPELSAPVFAPVRFAPAQEATAATSTGETRKTRSARSSSDSSESSDARAARKKKKKEKKEKKAKLQRKLEEAEERKEARRSELMDKKEEQAAQREIMKHAKKVKADCTRVVTKLGPILPVMYNEFKDPSSSSPAMSAVVDAFTRSYNGLAANSAEAQSKLLEETPTALSFTLDHMKKACEQAQRCHGTLTSLRAQLRAYGQI